MPKTQLETIYKKKIKGSVILITGGTGSFGNTVVTQLLPYHPKKIIVFSRDEKKQFDMRNKFNNPLLKFIIGDTRDVESTKKAMRNIDYVFHAAALKQVPTCEFFPMEAVKTNIIGTHNVLTAARQYGVKRVVVLSTDKSVYPINAMGLSKAMMEKVMIAESRSIIDSEKVNTVFCGVRYGNVLYTRGSVLPYFMTCMKLGKKLPVTDFTMTRFLLPLSHAVDLVLYALSQGENGHIYVRKSPATTMKTLAKAWCELFSYKPGYEEVGIRAGEKLHETLITQEEYMRSTQIGNYYKIPLESQGLDYNTYSRGAYQNKKNIQPYMSNNTQQLDIEQTKALLKTIPEIKEALLSIKKQKKI